MRGIDSPIARAIAELETEAQNLRARLVKVDEAITSLRQLFHLPPTPITATKGRRPPRSRGNCSGVYAIDSRPRSSRSYGMAAKG